MSLLERITLDSEICHGKPCVRHMRWPVEAVLDLVSSGMQPADILADHPEIEREDIAACLDFAARQARREELPILRDAA